LRRAGIEELEIVIGEAAPQIIEVVDLDDTSLIGYQAPIGRRIK
jgi:hypothetical protein